MKEFERGFALIVLVLLGSVWYSMGFLGVLVILVLISGLIASCVFAAWQMAKADILFTFIGIGEIKMVDRGVGNFWKILANLPGHHVEGEKIVEDSKEEHTKSYLEKRYGLYFIGFSPAKLHEFEFVHERINPDIKKGMPPDEWIKRDDHAQKTTTLLWEIPHWYLVSGVEFHDQMSGELLFNCMSRVTRPVVAIYLRRGQFIDYSAQYVNGAVIDSVRNENFSDLQGLQKMESAIKEEGGKTPLSEEIVSKVNVLLEDAVGLKMQWGFISQYDASDKSDQKALEARKVAQLEGEAKIETAKQAVAISKQTAKQTNIEAKAQLKADEIKSKGQMSGLEAALNIIKERFPDIDPSEALQRATELAVATKMSHPQSPVTVLGASVSIGVKTAEKK
ncbi:hypothetical protein H0W91_00440 [Patescibacteria group bacterium]|nr:hypothetical protein [Patescibacteria group bacterium]